MSDKKYIVSVVGVMKKNGQQANAGDEVTADQFNNFEDRILGGGYVKEKSDYKKEQEESDVKQLEAAEQKKREDFIFAYKKAFKVDVPADASTEDIEKAILAKKQIEAK